LRPQALSESRYRSRLLTLTQRPLPAIGNRWEQLAFQRLDRLPMRSVDDVRVDVERRRNARVSDRRFPMNAKGQLS
jgi:hypothetical protein